MWRLFIKVDIMALRNKVLKAIEENPGKTGADIAMIAGIKWAQVSGPLRYLQDSGLIYKKGASFRTIYFRS